MKTTTPMGPANDSLLTFNGRVLLPDNLPAATAAIWLATADEAQPQRIVGVTTTDTLGLFSISFSPNGPKADKYALFAEASGAGLTVSYIRSGHDLELTLAESATVEIAFQNNERLPIVGLSVAPEYLIKRREGFYSVPQELRLRYAQLTDELGRCRLTGLPQGFTLRACVSNELLTQPQMDDEIEITEAENFLDGAIILREAGSISGRVIPERTEHPPARIRVYAVGNGGPIQSGHATTDEYGNYLIGHLTPGRYMVVPMLQENVHGEWAASAIAEIWVEPDRDQPNVDIALVHAGLITGTVVMKGSRAPVARVTVRCEGPSRPSGCSFSDTTMTDSEGHFQFRVAPGLQQVCICDHGRPNIFTPRELDVNAGETRTVELEYTEPYSRSIRGLVTGPDGLPVDNAEVWIEPEDCAHFRTATRTDAFGQFQCDVAGLSGSLFVRARHDNCATRRAIAATGECELRIELEEGVLVSLYGTVVDAHARPKPGAKLILGTTGRNWTNGNP